MKFTVIITLAPYGQEKAYSALRFALTSILEGIDINIFLLEDGVYVAKTNQNPAEVPNYLEYLQNCIEAGAVVKVCGPCCKARGLEEKDLIDGVKLATMHDLVAFTKESDKVITF
ncbi:DsrE/DsrF/TusD sulfur relay family protein [Methanococcus aeolicus]|uniref:DsrE/DsrF/TusD sulfur relay family protein n=1 Tax=Methanococcus aeolicus TaxID=42879 RepID=UPI0021C90723|nr:DsrE/DsrF/TusD sulfur relay family protein [Methanococcus aeolicus]UXM84439.1 DsrE/DsrF/TusD sulfur relay family protein [Methanococcus aeolicus]